jgi:PmbA protein
MSLEHARTYLLERARAQGVQLEVYSSSGSSTRIQAHQGKVSEFNLTNRAGLGLRALVRGAWGYAYTENLAQAALDRALQDAVENASLVAPEPHATLGAWPEPPHVGDLYGEGLSGVTVDRKVRAAIELEQAAMKADPRVTVVAYSGYADGESEVAIANTSGLSRDYKANFAYQFAMPVVAEHGQNKSKFDWDFSREFETLDPTRTALKSVEKALGLLGGQPAPSGVFAVVIQHECMAQLLGTFDDIFSAKMVQEGKSPLSGKLGSLMANANVTIVDDATRPAGLASRPFDAEGYPSSPITIVESGQLLHLLHNTETAARDGVESTGHAARGGYKGTIGIAPSNMFLAPGDIRPEALMAGITDGVFLTSVTGTHAGANVITGDFSLQAEGFWVKDGTVAYPLEVFTVAGNFLTLLNDIEAVGNDLTFGPPAGAGSFGSPSVRVKSLSIGGK